MILYKSGKLPRLCMPKARKPRSCPALGYGYYSDFFARAGANPKGIDGTEKMIEIARELYPDLDFSVADIEKPLPFENESFDIVFSNQVLMDIENVDFVFSECNRVLKNSGIFWFSIVHPCFYDGQWVTDEDGYKSAKAIDKYISCYQLTNKFWGETAHFHRPLSFYLISFSFFFLCGICKILNGF